MGRLLFRAVADLSPVVTLFAMVDHWSLYIGIPSLFVAVILNYIDGAWDASP